MDTMYDYRPEYVSADEVDTCDVCGHAIFEGEEYYYIKDTTICCGCIEEFKKEAEKEGK